MTKPPKDPTPSLPDPYRRGWIDGKHAAYASGGRKRSAIKTAAARANGAKGGRPKQSPKVN